MKTVIEMARAAGCHDNGEEFRFVEFRYLERFAEIVRADEREACAKVADGFIGCDPIADKIRARSGT